MKAAGLVVLASSLLLCGCGDGSGRYTMMKKDEEKIWLLDTKTGEITVCWEAPLGATCQFATELPRMP